MMKGGIIMKHVAKPDYQIEELDDRVEFFFWGGFMDFMKALGSKFSEAFNEFVSYIKTTMPRVYNHIKDWLNEVKNYFSADAC